MQVFGLTGGLASGKSSVAAHWRRRGLPVLDADALAREVVAPAESALAELAAEFGAEVLRDGELDRKRLAQLVFGHPERLRRLEAITHPRILALRTRRLAELQAAGEPLVCSEVPLLFEKGLEAELRPIVVVTVPEALQRQRARERDGSSLPEVEARLAAQLPLAEKQRRADHVIDNQGSLAATLEQADRVLLQICRSLGVDPRRYGYAD
jgi:dephospho-CoA kinase